VGSVRPFYSVGTKPGSEQRHGHYHEQSECQFGQMIKLRGYDAPGTGGHRVCRRCTLIAGRGDVGASGPVSYPRFVEDL
jgi:hypothetical protein